MKKADIGVALYLLAAVIFFIVPISSTLLDVMIAINISIALIILFNTLFVKEVLDMSFFPTLLLFTTIFRISLNVSSTRLILSTGAPGNVVTTFGQFVGGGDLVIGAIIFIVLIIIQFVVINKGSERVAEANRPAEKICARSLRSAKSSPFLRHRPIRRQYRLSGFYM